MAPARGSQGRRGDTRSWHAGTSDRASTRRALEAGGTKLMIFVVVKFTIRVERSNEWLSLIDDFTQATRQAGLRHV